MGSKIEFSNERKYKTNNIKYWGADLMDPFLDAGCTQKTELLKNRLV